MARRKPLAIGGYRVRRSKKWGVRYHWGFKYRGHVGSGTFDSYDAMAAAASVKRAEIDRLGEAARRTAKGRQRFGEYTAALLERERARLRPTSFRAYETSLRLHISPYFGAMKLGSITPDDVRTWHGPWLSSERPKLRSKAQPYRSLKWVFGHAVEDGRILANPCTIKGAGASGRRSLHQATPADVWKLANAIDRRYKAMVLVAGFMGLRIGELAGLQRRDITLGKAPWITVARQLTRARTYTDPKTAAGRRRVPMPNQVAKAMKEHLGQVGADPESPVFTSASGCILDVRNFQRRWDKARIKAGLPDLTFHALRHVAGTLMAQSGFTVPDLQATLGHASPAASLGYLHANTSRQREAMDRMSLVLAEPPAKLTEGALSGADG